MNLRFLVLALTMLHAFHDFTQPVELLVNLKKSLKDDGIVVVIDWRTILKKDKAERHGH